ncbi:uncharacterized protein LODBEIA_P44090 [Lodderomyces beijingensis]|uniref:Uncharacterized protein n=1 Tax=Lodderomyces beijingensis TaxID=1775926 RepID=A0ABP0ZV92_9ASCO
MIRFSARTLVLLLSVATFACAAIVGIDLGSQFTKSVLLAPAVPFEIILTDEGSRKEKTGIQLFTEQNLEENYDSQLVSLAMVLDDIRDRAAQDLGGKLPAIIDVAINIPAASSQVVRRAYLDSLNLANVSSVLGLVEDGTAVALNFVSNQQFDNVEKEYYIVFDAGAGSTKATLFSVKQLNGQTVVEMESVGSDENFGGQVLTNSIHELIEGKALNHFGLDHLPEKTSKRLYTVAEKAKTVLSANSEFSTVVESVYDDEDFKVYVTREEFEDVNSDLMQHVTQPVLDALKLGGVEVEDVKSVILNGGSTRIPFVKEHIALLFGEEKISKSVNTDESAALGTTQRGLQLKINSAKDIQLIEKCHHNYEVGVNDSDESLMVFASGAVVGTTKSIELDLENNNDNKDIVTITLYEDGSLLKSYQLDGIDSKLSCKSGEKKKLNATFEINESKIFDLVALRAHCVKKETSFLGNLLKKDNSEKDTNDNDNDNDNENGKEVDDKVEVEGERLNTTSSTSPQKPKTKFAATIAIPIPKASFPHVQPLNDTTRRVLLKEIARLHKLEEEKLQSEEIRNELESQLYQFRETLEIHEAELKKELTEDEIASYFEYITDLIEWFDFDSDEVSLDDLKNKIDEVKEKEFEVKKHVRMTSTDLSKEGMRKLHEDGTKLLMSIQSSMLKLGQGVSDMRKKYQDSNLDFDKENDRIKLKSAGQENQMLSFDRNLAEYKEIITKIGELIEISDAKFNEISKRELYTFHDMLAKGVSEMLLDLIKLESSHGERMKLLEEQYGKLLARQQQKEYRKKLRKAAKEAEKKKTKESDKAEEVSEAATESGTLEHSETIETASTENDANTEEVTSSSLSSSSSSTTEASESSETTADTVSEPPAVTSETHLEHDEL